MALLKEELDQPQPHDEGKQKDLQYWTRHGLSMVSSVSIFFYSLIYRHSNLAMSMEGQAILI